MCQRQCGSRKQRNERDGNVASRNLRKFLFAIVCSFSRKITNPPGIGLFLLLVVQNCQLRSFRQAELSPARRPLPPSARALSPRTRGGGYASVTKQRIMRWALKRVSRSLIIVGVTQSSCRSCAKASATRRGLLPRCMFYYAGTIIVDIFGVFSPASTIRP